MNTIPENFARTQIELNGDKGVEWLNRLPGLIAECEQRWALSVEPPFAPLSYNYVAPARRTDGTEAVLKLGFPNPELTTEIEALRLYNGRSIVQLLEADPDQGVLLLERLKPGKPLAHLADDEAMTSIAAQVMQQLWRPAPSAPSGYASARAGDKDAPAAPPEGGPFPSVADWAKGLQKLRARFEGGCGPLPAALVAQAEALFAELLNSMTEPRLLHGDLHHENILSAERQPWLAIDPKGIVGEPAYEVGPLLLNQIPDSLTEAEMKSLLARRLDQLTEALGFERERLRNYGLAHSVLSAWWSLEDHGHGWEGAIACAELLNTL